MADMKITVLPAKIIITKSISRFAGNTADCLNTIRELKEKNVPVIFEKENIRTGRIPYKSRAFCLFCCSFVAYLSLKSAKRYSMISDSMK